jgi:hypothetical protein
MKHNLICLLGAVMVMIIWQLDLQLPMHSVPINANVVSFSCKVLITINILIKVKLVGYVVIPWFCLFKRKILEICHRWNKKSNSSTRESTLFLPPVIFSRFDIPDKDYLYRGEVSHKPGYINPDQSRPTHLIGTSKSFFLWNI